MTKKRFSPGREIPVEAPVCNHCGTRYGEAVFGGTITLQKGTCWCCGREGNVSPAKQYGNMVYPAETKF